MFRVAIVTLSDKGAAGQRTDESGAVIRGGTLIVNLPGSPKAVRENLEYVIPALGHGLEILTGRAGECARK